MYPAAFEYAAPTSVEEAVDCLQSLEDEEAKVLAGGQSLIPLMRLRFARPSHLVDINRISALGSLRSDNGSLRIGALVRESELESSPVVRDRFPVLYETSRGIADPSVRNLATVGGNLAHGDPANDHPAVMMALDATVVAVGPGGERVIPASNFFAGLFETALRQAEILTEIRIPPLSPATGVAYRKFKRQVGDFAVVAVAARLTVEPSVIGDARLLFTNVGVTPFRARDAERALVGEEATDECLWSAAGRAAAELEPADDLRGSADYKRRVARVLTFQALCSARERAVNGS